MSPKHLSRSEAGEENLGWILYQQFISHQIIF